MKKTVYERLSAVCLWDPTVSVYYDEDAFKKFFGHIIVLGFPDGSVVKN